MTAFTAPFELHQKVRKKAPGDSKEIFQITRQMLDEDGTWKVQQVWNDNPNAFAGPGWCNDECALLTGEDQILIPVSSENDALVREKPSPPDLRFRRKPGVPVHRGPTRPERKGRGSSRKCAADRIREQDASPDPRHVPVVVGVPNKGQGGRGVRPAPDRPQEHVPGQIQQNDRREDGPGEASGNALTLRERRHRTRSL